MVGGKNDFMEEVEDVFSQRMSCRIYPACRKDWEEVLRRKALDRASLLQAGLKESMRRR